MKHLDPLKFKQRQSSLDNALIYDLANNLMACQYLEGIGANVRSEDDFVMRAALLIPNLQMAEWAIRKGCSLTSIDGARVPAFRILHEF